MRGEKDELHAADEVRAGHDNKGGIWRMRSSPATPAEVLPISSSGRLGDSGNLVHLPAYQAAGIIGGGQHHKADEADAPPIALIEYLPEARRQQRAGDPRPTPDEHSRAHRRRAPRAPQPTSRLRLAVHASDTPSQHASRDHDAEEAVRARHQRQARG